jgi:hypothetical protein
MGGVWLGSAAFFIELQVRGVEVSQFTFIFSLSCAVEERYIDIVMSSVAASHTSAKAPEADASAQVTRSFE